QHASTVQSVMLLDYLYSLASVSRTVRGNPACISHPQAILGCNMKSALASCPRTAIQRDSRHDFPSPLAECRQCATRAEPYFLNATKQPFVLASLRRKSSVLLFG